VFLQDRENIPREKTRLTKTESASARILTLSRALTGAI